MRYHDVPDEVPHRLRVKPTAPRPTLDQRLTALEHKVAELSSVVHGITQQLVDVSSSVHDMALLPGVSGVGDVPSDTEATSSAQPRKKRQTTYIIADADDPPRPQRRLGSDIIIADREG